MSNEWLKNLKVGDQVALITRGSAFRISTVERLTKTQIVLKGGLRYRKRDGREVGGGTIWFNGHLQPLTPQMLESSKKNQLISKIKTFSFENMTLDKLWRIWEIIKEE